MTDSKKIDAPISEPNRAPHQTAARMNPNFNFILEPGNGSYYINALILLVRPDKVVADRDGLLEELRVATHAAQVTP